MRRANKPNQFFGLSTRAPPFTTHNGLGYLRGDYRTVANKPRSSAGGSRFQRPISPSYMYINTYYRNTVFYCLILIFSPFGLWFFLRHVYRVTVVYTIRLPLFQLLLLLFISARSQHVFVRRANVSGTTKRAMSAIRLKKR